MVRFISICPLLVLCWARSNASHLDYDLKVHISIEEDSSESSEDVVHPQAAYPPLFSIETVNFLFNGPEQTANKQAEQKRFKDDDWLYGYDVFELGSRRRKRAAQNTSDQAVPTTTTQTPYETSVCDCNKPNYTGDCVICLNNVCTNCTVVNGLCVSKDESIIDTKVCRPRTSFGVDCHDLTCKAQICYNDKCLTEVLNSTTSSKMSQFLGNQFGHIVGNVTLTSLLNGFKTI